uniref:Glutaredoxin n=1 Tax=Porphyridium purpureum TaxID=35688 RepID=W0RZ01_PORPP|nr:glutaredoxin-related protein [Porphyridium purpureum]ATJ03009.1 glutaredoxin-related protein [Porphyridium purpureum]BAO23796.1 glutaredoxin-related protein [Porphyridium purpureum]
MDSKTKQQFDHLISSYNIILFMKGTKLMPMCGFSNTVVQILNSINANYHTVNVLDDPNIREGIKLYSNWPTIPQLYINSEFIGGADIVIDLYQKGELHEMIEKNLAI